MNGMVIDNDADNPTPATPPPWPIVQECNDTHVVGTVCTQCDGTHTHHWAAWHDARRRGHRFGPGIPVRCTVCGARKCDVATCLLRRHHKGHHEHY